MRVRSARLRDLFAFATVVWCSGLSAARAQSVGLGGYGAMSSSSPSSMGSGGPIIPYGGNLSGFMPFRMGAGGNGLSFSSRSSSQTWPTRTAFRLSPMSTPMTFGGVVQDGRSRTGSLESRFSMGLMRPGAGMGSQRQGVMPPSFAYPFYQPPSLLLPAFSFTGMASM